MGFHFFFPLIVLKMITLIKKTAMRLVYLNGCGHSGPEASGGCAGQFFAGRTEIGKF